MITPDRFIGMSMDIITTPADIQDGEVLPAIRVGGPRDGDLIGYATVTLEMDGAISLFIEPVSS